MFHFFRTKSRREIRAEIGSETAAPAATVDLSALMGGGYNANLQIVTVYACVRVIAETLGMLPLNLYDVSDRLHVRRADHPLADCLSLKPNDYQTSAEFMEYLAASVCLEGNFYAQIIRIQRAVSVNCGPLIRIPWAYIRIPRPALFTTPSKPRADSLSGQPTRTYSTSRFSPWTDTRRFGADLCPLHPES